VKHPAFISLATALLLALLPGCPDNPEPTGRASAADTTPAAQNEICETLPATESSAVAVAPDSSQAKPEPEPRPEAVPALKPQPEPEPEPPSKPEALPRMWDYGSEKCIPCKEMEKILTPMIDEYAGRVDIRIVNVYEEQEAAKQAGIQIIPTQVFYDTDGKELFRHVGAYPRDSIVARFKEYGWE
jgi:thioredoxin 1